MDQLDVIAPQATYVEYRGERLEVRPLTIGKLPELIRKARTLINAVLHSGLDSAGDQALVPIVLDLIGRHSEEAFDVVALLVDRDRAWVEQGNCAEFLDLSHKLVTVNRDFFTRTVGPLLADLRKQDAGTGATASSSSSSTATG